MVWNKRAKLHVVILLFGILQVSSVSSQNNNQPVWSDDQWQQAKDGIDFQEYPAEKEDLKEEEQKPKSKNNSEFETEESNESSWSLGEIFSSSLAKFIGIMLLLIILIFVVYAFMQGGRRNKDEKIRLALESLPDVLEDLPHETDLEKFLRLSMESGDYKSAIRILYIMIIQRMHETNWIIWKKDKTNRDYLNEVRYKNSYPRFREITLVYEIIWYGDNEINGTEFHKLKSVFDVYKGSINGSTESK